MNIHCDVIVIGAGVSGLAAAFYLKRAGLRVEVIEAARRAGGVIATEKRDGFLYERGPNSALENVPIIGELIEALHISGERIDVSAAAKKRFIVKNGRLVPLPMSPAALIATPLFSARAKFRLLGEPFVSRAPDVQESVAQFVTRRLGREFLDYAVEPFVAGIYAGDPTELSVKAAFPRMYALEERHGGIFKGQIRGARAREHRRVPKSFSFVNGMQTLTDALAREVGAIRLNTRGTRISRSQDGSIAVDAMHEGVTSQFQCRALVLAVAADRASALVRELQPAATDALDAMPYAPIASAALGYARNDITHALDGFGFLVPRVENRRILGCLFSSSMFPGRAAEGDVLFTVYIGGRRQPELLLKTDAEISAIAGDELQPLVGARSPPRFSAVTRWPRAIPQYTLGHLDRVTQAERVQRALPGLFLCASYRGGISISDCIQSAHATAEAVRAYR